MFSGRHAYDWYDQFSKESVIQTYSCITIPPLTILITQTKFLQLLGSLILSDHGFPPSHCQVPLNDYQYQYYLFGFP